MSLTPDGQHISCDAEGCRAEARLPVALRARLSAGARTIPAAQGWLFVSRRSGRQHYCPACATRALEVMWARPDRSKEG